MTEQLKEISAAVYDGDEGLTEELVKKALGENVDPESIIQEAGVTAMNRLSEEFDNLNVFLPELVIGGECMKILTRLCSEKLVGEGGGFKGKVVIGCAKGDLHDIGKSLVGTQLSINGFEVIDLGTDVATNKFIDTAVSQNADIIAVSSLLTTSQYYMEELVKRLEQEGKRDQFKIAVGGGPIGPEYAEKIGADGYSRTAGLSVPMALRLMEKKPGDALIVEL